MQNIHPVCLTDKNGNIYSHEQIKRESITMKWNHNHPPKMPSNFEVFKDNKMIYSGVFTEGMRIAKEHLDEQNTVALTMCQKENLMLRNILDKHNISI
jgi:hypothetical protein